jgi:hypothetical protein
VDPSLRLQANKARVEIADGALRGKPLLELLLSVPPGDRDVWTDELLGIRPPPPDAPDLPRGSVPYLPCGVEEILAVVRDAPVHPGDELVDLGSGLGRVAVLVHLLSGARTCGIEIQEHLVRDARARCDALALPDVSFVHADASKVELDGSVFFLYAPFNGAMFTSVLSRLEEVAHRRSIVVCAVGVELGGLPWLSPRASATPSVSLYDSMLGIPARGS